MKKVNFLLIGLAICTFAITSCHSEKSENANTNNYENMEKNDSYPNLLSSNYKKEKEKEEPNHPRWCIGSWRIKIDDVNVMIANIYGNEVNIRIMHGFTVADSETLNNWTVEDGVLYMYNGSNKYGSYSFTADERNKVLYHNGRAMQKH